MKPGPPTPSDQSLWLWRSVWALILLSFVGIAALYRGLPLDGSTGDSSSFSPAGFLVKEIIEERPNGLQAGDVITHMDGQTIAAWLPGPPRHPEWSPGEIVSYTVRRDGQPLVLQIQLIPVSFSAVVARWGLQMLVVLCFFIIGSVIFWRRPHEPAARWQMLFCVLLALQYWIDGYNLQPGTLLWGWPFWFHYALENFSWFLAYSALLMFALVFPQTNIFMRRFPRLGPVMVLSSGLIVQLAAFSFAASIPTAINLGSRVSFFPVIGQLILAVGISIQAAFTNRSPVARAQLKWIIFGSSVPLVIALFGYSLPVALLGKPLVPREVSMLSSVLVPLSFGAAVLRYRIFDIEIIINRGLVYGTLTTLLAGLYLVLVRGFTMVAQALVPTSNEALIVFSATLIIALAFAPLRERVQAWIDTAFFRSKVNFQRLLPELSTQLSTNIILEKLTPLLIDEIPRQLQIASATLLVLDADEQELTPPSGDRSKSRPQDNFSLPVDHPVLAHLRQTKLPILSSQAAHLPEQVNNLLRNHAIELRTYPKNK
jgi:hypothetical protein